MAELAVPLIALGGLYIASNRKEQEAYTNMGAPNNALPNVCLLYTSPSPRDRTRSRMPSSA